MRKDKQFVSIQNFIDKKVIDSKGVLLGAVKDFKVSIGEPDIELVVTSETGETIEIPWSDVQSAEDFIILKKTMKPPKVTAAQPSPTKPSPPIPKPSIICQNCGVKVPGHAKFCPKCGNKIK